MISTEFLLYLVIVVFAVFVIITYQKDEPSKIQYVSNDHKNEESQQKSPRRMNNSYQPVFNQMNNFGPEIPYGPPMPQSPPVPPIDPLRKFDYDAVHDNFTPPFRRSYYDEFDMRLTPELMPFHSRGPQGRFRKVGMLIAEGVSSNDKYKFLIMMGRQKYTGREFEYFATSSDSDKHLKFYIETKGKEINDGDLIKLNELDGYTFKFKEDQDLSPRYDPYYV